jgi:predicted molibdopterin-dependent oxidoreductase YjgC
MTENPQASMRLSEVERGQPVSLLINGRAVTAYRGETIATALMAEGRRAYRYSPQAERLPGFFCGIGICYGCTVWVDGYLKRACLTEVEEGLEILTGPDRQNV